WVQLEKEYEVTGKVQDERDYSSWVSHIQVGFGVWPNLTIRLGAEYAYEGVLRKTFDSSIPISNSRIQLKGSKSFNFSAQYYSEKKDLALEIYARANPLHAKETNASLGGYDEGFAVKYLHRIDDLSVYGKVFVEISGKKRSVR